MKLIRNILLIATGLSMASCNYLDVNTDTKDRMSLEEVFTDETYTEQDRKSTRLNSSHAR